MLGILVVNADSFLMEEPSTSIVGNGNVAADDDDDG
jgi:hypothetical protein